MHKNEVDFMKDDETIQLIQYGYEAAHMSNAHVNALQEQLVRQGVFPHISNAKEWFKEFIG